MDIRIIPEAINIVTFLSEQFYRIDGTVTAADMQEDLQSEQPSS
jgi:hypothetical protein